MTEWTCLLTFRLLTLCVFILIPRAIFLSNPNVWITEGRYRIGRLSAEMTFLLLSSSYLSEKLLTEAEKSLIPRAVVTWVVSHFRQVCLRHIFMCFSLLALVIGLKGIIALIQQSLTPKRFQIASGNLHHISRSSRSSLETYFSL